MHNYKLWYALVVTSYSTNLFYNNPVTWVQMLYLIYTQIIEGGPQIIVVKEGNI